MSDLNTKATAIWDAVKAIVDASVESGTLKAIEEFVEYRRLRSSQMSSMYLVVLDRAVEVQEWGANRGIAFVRVVFGISGSSFQPEEIGVTLEGYAWALADLFMADLTLDGKVHETRLESLRPDTIPVGEEQTTNPWATVELSWDFDFLIGG